MHELVSEFNKSTLTLTNFYLLSKTNEFTIHEFASGIRMVHKQIAATQIAHCGFIINAGARDEENDAAGVAHFIEHMLFKGTLRKNHRPFFRAWMRWVPSKHLHHQRTNQHLLIISAAISATGSRCLTDICFHSTFPSEMEKEKK